MLPKHFLARFSMMLWGLLALWLCSFPNAASADASEDVRRRMEALAAGLTVEAGSDPLMANRALRKFYQERGFQLAWFQNNRLVSEALELLQTINHADRDGLRPDDYHKQEIDALIRQHAEKPTESSRIDLDLLLSDAFLMLGSHLLAGKVDPKTLEPEWFANRDGLTMAPLLAQALETGSVEALLTTFRPSQPGYQRLREARQQIQNLIDTGIWKHIPYGPLIRPGETDARLPSIAARLVALGDLTASDTLTKNYNTELLAAVSSFQSRHGLDPDGVIGPATVDALNISPSARLQRLAVNMERWRWMPERLGGAHALVNIAANELYLVKASQPVLSSPVRISSQCRNSAVFTDSIHYIVLNPTWTVPATGDRFPELAKLTAAQGLAGLGFDLYRGWGVNAVSTAATRSTLSAGNRESRPWRLVQSAGPQNALGQVKFMFSGSTGPFLHGVPSQGMFSENAEKSAKQSAQTSAIKDGTTSGRKSGAKVGAKSGAKGSKQPAYGCIQVKDALKLADQLLGQKPGWSYHQVKSSDSTRHRSETHYLKEPMPLHVQYLTAWGDRNGLVQVRRDSQKRDQVLANALGKPFQPEKAP